MSASPPAKGKIHHHGPPPPTELINNNGAISSSLELLAQGAEARVWLLSLSNSIPDNDVGDGRTNSNKKQRSIHVGSGINVPQLLNFTQHPSPLFIPNTNTSSSSSSSSSIVRRIICKERFPKKYRHPQLDITLTKSRTKGEARSLVRCQRANVNCPAVLAIAHWSNGSISRKEDSSKDKSSEKKAANDTDNNKNSVVKRSTTSSCLFMECVDGCTVRQYFEHRSEGTTKVVDDKNDDNNYNTSEPMAKRPRSEDESTSQQQQQQQHDRVTTVINTQTLSVANAIGYLVAKMHSVGVIHGDLTTSNIMLRNPPPTVNDIDAIISNSSSSDGVDAASWEPQLVLIDFGLATSTSSTSSSSTNLNNKSNKANKQHKQQHNAEEKAVDLYVLERAFLSTHPESELLVEEVWKGYCGYFDKLDDNDEVLQKNKQKQKQKQNQDVDNKDEAVPADGSEKKKDSTGGMFSHVAKSVMNRLEQVRMRGRKRECFG